jgi:uncharacterized protein HemX
MALWKRKSKDTAEEKKEMPEQTAGEEQESKLEKEGTQEAPEGASIEEVKPEPLKKEKKPSKIARFFRSILVGILLLVIGAAAVYFGVHMPKTGQLNAQVASSQDQITQLTAQLTSQTEKLTGVQGELEQAKTEITSLQSDLNTMSELKVVYEIQSNVNIARLALEQNDATRAVQAVEYIIQDIRGLSISSFPNISGDLSQRLTDLENIRVTIGINPTQAVIDLEDLFNDLLLLANNLEKQ